MNQLLQNAMRCIEGRTRDAARMVIERLIFSAIVGLTWIVGFGFLTASAYFALSTVVGSPLAAFINGVGLILLAGVLQVLTKRGSSKPTPEGAGKVTSVAERTDASNLAPTVAFTAAFMLARYFSSGKPD